MSSLTPLPDPRLCDRARQSRDSRFDGLFFTAVRTTGIYCRPVCPAPVPRRRNITYYATAAAAEAAGYRPCLRCRPELSPEQGTWRRGDEVVARAVKLIDQGLLAGQPLAALARRVNLGERQLRRLFVDRLGTSPIGVHATRRLLFAKNLLTDTALPVTQVALAAGFGSLRRFNTTFRAAYRMAPRDLRRLRPPSTSDETLVLRLNARPPYDFASMLDFLRARQLSGVEAVDASTYSRTFGTPQSPAWLRVSPWTGGGDAGHALRLELHGCPPGQLLEVVGRIRRMFDLDAEPQAIGQVLARDARLAPLVRRRPGLRVPGGWDGFEIAVRAILGQQVSVAAASTLAARLSRQLGTPVPGHDIGGEAGFLFPAPEQIAQADLTGLGLTRSRAETLRGMAKALLEGEVDFNAEHTLDEFVRRWSTLRGIGPWTAHYIALRALGHPDAFPAEDLVLCNAVVVGRLAPAQAARQLRERAEAWRPWRAYAVIHLWHEAALAARRRRKEDA